MSTESPRISHERPCADPTTPGKVLLALSADEMALFFPEGFDGGGATVEWKEPALKTQVLYDMLQHAQPDVVVTAWTTPAFEVEWLDEFPALRYICHASGSVRNLVPRVFLERGVLVSNWGTLAASNVAEHALLLTLAGLRRMSEWSSVISGQRPWQPSPIVTRTLFRKRVGVHGMGNVAQCLVRLLACFEVSVSAYSEGVPQELYDRCGVKRCERLEDLFADNDIVIECEALSAHTQGIVTREILNRLPYGALFVNVGRGAVVDEAALAELARAGRCHVALDVYETDPIDPQSPLHEVEDGVLSPHIAGPTSDQFACCGQLAMRNVRAFLAGEPVEAVVDLPIYDRST